MHKTLMDRGSGTGDPRGRRPTSSTTKVPIPPHVTDMVETRSTGLGDMTPEVEILVENDADIFEPI